MMKHEQQTSRLEKSSNCLGGNNFSRLNLYLRFFLKKFIQIVLLLTSISVFAGERTLKIGIENTTPILIKSFETANDLKDITTMGATIELDKFAGRNVLKMVIEKSPNSWPGVFFNAGDGFSADWTKYDGISFSLASNSTKSLAITIQADTVHGERRFVYLLPVTPELRQVVLLFKPNKSLESDAYNLLKGISGIEYEPIVYDAVPNATKIHRMWFYMSKPEQDTTIYLANMQFIQKLNFKVPVAGLVDAFGQCSVIDWPNKIKSETELKSKNIAYDQELEKSFAKFQNERDSYGGILNSNLKLNSSGFFKLNKINQEWIFVTPDGNPFYMMAMCNVGPVTSPTMLAGREKLFSEIPAGEKFKDIYQKDYYGQGRICFEVANLIRCYDSKWYTKGCERAYKEVRTWGFNSIHNWFKPEEMFNLGFKIPYAVSLRQDRKANMMTDGIRHGMPDVFAPDYASIVENTIRDTLLKLQADPYLMGYFIEGERDWSGLLKMLPSLSNATYTKKELVKFLQNRYHNQLEEMTKSWGAKVDSFENPVPAGKNTPTMQKDIDDFFEIYANRYFETVTTIIHKYDPNHLIFGERAHSTSYIDGFIRASSRYCDAISYNVYQEEISAKLFDHVYKLAAKPVIIGEFGFRGNDRGMAGTQVFVFNQKERGSNYTNYVKKLLDTTYIVGFMWFCYRDQAFSGVPFGEAFNYGFISSSNLPYDELVASAKAMNQEVYKIKLDKINQNQKGK